MARRGIVIEIVGDERSYLRAAENTIASNTKLNASFKTTGVNAQLSANAQVAAAVRSQQAMRENVAALQAAAARAPAGSAEQVAATRLATEAQAKLARSYGVTGTAAAASAQEQITAAVTARKAMEANVLALREEAATLPAGSAEQLAAVALATEAQEKLTRAYGTTGAAAALSADEQIASLVKVQETQRASLRVLESRAATLPAGSPEQQAALLLATEQQAKLARATGETTTVTRGFSAATRTAEGDLNKATRGVLSGSGIMTRFGRSLAFASSSFLGFAIGASAIAKSITDAEDLAKAQRSLGVAIQHTGGNLRDLEPRYTAIAKAAAQFGVSQLDATTGLARATVLTGNAAAAQRAYQEALVISKATGKDFSSVLIATSKGQEGVTTSLRRYGILVKSTSSGQEQFNQVMRRFGGQAEANTTASDRLRAVLANTAASIGTELLPTFEQLAASLENWLQKMNESGRLQRDVKTITGDTVAVFKTLGQVIGIVDKVTGSFANTLKILVALKFASILAGWLGALEQLSLKWKAVAASATAAKAAEEGALLGGGAVVAGAARAETAGVAAGALTSRSVLSSREAATANNAINKSLGRDVEASVSKGLTAGVVAGASVAQTKLGGLKGTLAGLASKPIAIAIALTFIPPNKGGKDFLSQIGLGKLGSLPIIGPLDQQVARLTKTVLDLNQKLPRFLRVPLPPTTPLRPLTPDTTFSFGGQKFIAGTAQAFQALTSAGAKLPDIANVTAKQELKAALALDKGAKESKAVAKRVAEAIQAINEANAPLVQGGIFTPQARRFPRTGSIVPPPFQAPGFVPPPPDLPKPLPRLTKGFRDFGKAIRVWTTFQLTLAENLAQARASLTQGTADDVAAAKEVVARVKRAIDQGHLSGKSLLAALQVESSALSTIWSAEDAAAQKRAAAAQAAKDKIVQQIQNAIDPLKLEVALSRAEAFGKPILPPLKALLRAAEAGLRKAIAAHNLELENEALQQIASLKQQIKDARTTATQTFELSPRLQLALARDQALGIDPTKDLLKAKAAILKFIRTHKHNLAALTAAYQQLGDINQQLGSTARSAIGLFKQANTRALTKGLGLTDAQRAVLRARFSQLGPGQTTPGIGTGAAGFAIDPETGRPIGRQARQGSGRAAIGGRVGGRGEQNPVIDLNVYIDGKQVEATVTRRQQKRRRRNPSQRRGPNAGMAGG